MTAVTLCRFRMLLRIPTCLLLISMLEVGEVQAQAARPSDLTLEEKSSLITGRNSWETEEVPRLDIPAAWMTDGPVGLRKSTESGPAEPSTCFPSAAAMAATWNLDLIERVGAGIGLEARSRDVSLLLAPGLNIKRHPRGGRNFEYYSEDPLLSGRMAAAFVRGVQSQGVGATLKHFAVNNQEDRRMSIDARLDERTLREIYLRGFEIAVRESQPAAVMSAYNRVNGVFASQSPRLLTEILRHEWGFEGLVISDWGAVNDIVVALAAGLDLEMPGNPLSPALVAQAVRDGRLDEADLDRAVAQILTLAERQKALERPTSPGWERANHDLARQVAVESMVLLKNDGILPLSAESGRVGIAGRLAFEPRIQGIGSSTINPTRVDDPWTALERAAATRGLELAPWRESYGDAGLDSGQRASLKRFLAAQDVVVVFAGQPASHDAEAWDRPSTRLSRADLEILSTASKLGKPTAVVLTAGGAVDLSPFDADANAILMGWLGGQAFGTAVAQVLTGESDPSGRLSETFSFSPRDHASDLNFPGGPRAVTYGERQFVGYRFFESFGRAVAYPFGHGLSYTTFELTEARAPAEVADFSGGIDVSLRLTNTGARSGSETVQIYLRHAGSELERPDRELVAFRKLALDAGETSEVNIHIESERLAYFHDGHEQWVIEPGDYELLVGTSATDIRARLPVRLLTGNLPRRAFTPDDIIGDIVRDPRGQAVVDAILSMQGRAPLTGAPEFDFFAALLRNLPFRKLSNFSEGALTPARLEQLLMLINSEMTPEQVVGMMRRK